MTTSDDESTPATRRFAVDFLPGVTNRVVEDAALATPAREAAIELGDVTRRLLDAVVSAELPPEELCEIASTLADMSGRLEKVSRGERAAHAADDSAAGVRLFNPAVGLASPIAPPVRLYETPLGADLGWLEFSRIHEGIPGHAHGGFTALVLDQIMTRANGLAGQPGVTLEMQIHYHHVVPLDVRLRVGAEVQKREGRKLWTRSWIAREAEPMTHLASATGMFLQLPAGRVLELFEQRTP